VSDYGWRDLSDLSVVAERPGVYLFRSGEGKVLYVGKALNLRARLRAYLPGRSPVSDGRLVHRFLERDAERVETIVTRTEQEALLLEDSLVKLHKPIHNIRLKDDKSFLMVRIDEEDFPRLKLVRAHQPRFGKAKGRSRLFGPYASARDLRAMLADLQRVVPLRDCSDATMRNRTRPCLKHDLGLCSAPCVGKISAEAYDELLERAARILAGESEPLERDLEERMREASARLDYELAAGFRDRLAALRRAVGRQAVRAGSHVERDVLGLARAGSDALVQRLEFRAGRLVASESHFFRCELTDEELLHGALTELYARGTRSAPAEILLRGLPVESDLLRSLLGGVELVVPRAGERERMLALAEENARVELERRQAGRVADAEALEELARLAGCEEKDEPLVVDGFDVSNLQGTHVVASRVRFRGGFPDRAGYRRFRVRGVRGQDDFAALHEVVGRSLRRGLAEGDLPDLVVVDGGAAQLAKALEAREDAGAWDVRIVGLAKARPERRVGARRKERSEERLFLPGRAEPLELAPHSALRHLLERIRDEAHRFAITYHRKERGRLRSRLDEIPGVGPKKRRELLRRFGSVIGIERASEEELATVPGISTALARTIREHLARG
jgi:excinuclease ABC subunit C